MMVDSKHVYNLTLGSKTYQAIDNEEGEAKPVHRYTVVEWERKGFSEGGRILGSDVQIYAKSKFEAIKNYRIKYERVAK